MDQFLLGDGTEGLSDGTPAGSTVPCSLQQVYLQGFVVPLLEVSAHLPKLRQLQPAGLGGAAARHTMAFASPLHGPFHCLQGEQREGFRKSSGRGHFCTAMHAETWLQAYGGVWYQFSLHDSPEAHRFAFPSAPLCELGERGLQKVINTVTHRLCYLRADTIVLLLSPQKLFLLDIPRSCFF